MIASPSRSIGRAHGLPGRTTQGQDGGSRLFGIDKEICNRHAGPRHAPSPSPRTHATLSSLSLAGDREDKAYSIGS